MQDCWMKMKMAEKEDKCKERKGMKMVRKEKTLKRSKHRLKREKLFLD